MSRVVLNGPAARVLIAAAVVVLFGLIIYSMSGFPAPRESDRVRSLDGSFSIIKPRDFESRVGQSSPTANASAAIEFYSPKSIGLGERLVVVQLRQPPKIDQLKSDGFESLQFQGQQAWSRGKKSRTDYTIQIFFQRHGDNWYRMELRLARADELQKTNWWPFMESFQCSPIRGIGSATQATQPATTSSN